METAFWVVLLILAYFLAVFVTLRITALWCKKQWHVGIICTAAVILYAAAAGAGFVALQ